MPCAIHFRGKMLAKFCSQSGSCVKLRYTPEMNCRISTIGMITAVALLPDRGSAETAMPSTELVITPVVLLLQFISGVYFVYNDLPSWLQRVADVFPLKWIAQGMRSVFLPDGFQANEVSGSWQHGPTALVLAVWLVVGLVLSVRYFTWMRRDAG